MVRAKTFSRLQRLDILAARLKSDELLIVRELAAEMEVSVRTLSRDIELLRERGLPIEADRGRGGGIRLHWSWGIGKISLNYREAVDLMVSLAIVEQMNSPILMANLAPVRRKLLASFSPRLLQQIRHLKARILIGQTASVFVQTGYTAPPPLIIQKLHEAFLLTRTLEISYADGEGRISKRRVEPHFLLLNYPVWYMLCWDRSRNDVRKFRCDRVQCAAVEDETFKQRDYAQFEASLEGSSLVLP